MGLMKAMEIFNEDQEVKKIKVNDFENQYYSILEEDYNSKIISKFNWSGKEVFRQQKPIRTNKIFVALMTPDSIRWVKGVTGLWMMFRKSLRTLS